MDGRNRWAAIGAVAAFGAALLGAAPLALRSSEGDWGKEAGAAARRRIVALVPDAADVQFAGVKVRDGGGGRAKSVCGSFAVWDGDGSLGPFRDFWVVVTKRADALDADPMDITHDAFLDRGSAYYLSCFEGDG